MKWQIHEAKARFCEMVKRTLREGPQIVTRRGEPVAVLVAVEEYQSLRSGAKSLKTLLASAPLQGVAIFRSRDRSRVIARASRKTRRESMRVNAEFAAIEHGPDAQ